jgi:hypothetical protein
VGVVADRARGVAVGRTMGLEFGSSLWSYEVSSTHRRLVALASLVGQVKHMCRISVNS